MASDAASVDEKLSGEFTKTETPPNLGAVDDDRLRTVSQSIVPLRQDVAVAIEQRQP